MKFFSLAALGVAFAMASGAAAADPVDVSFSVAGQPGAWTIDFSFSNHLSTPASLYFLGVKTDGALLGSPSPFIQAFGGSYNTSSAGGSNTLYNAVWLDTSAQGLKPGQTVSGFTVRTTSTAQPVSFEWFAMTRGATVTDSFNFGSATTAGFQGTVMAAAVPEPTTYMLMAAGLGALGLLARRRRTA